MKDEPGKTTLHTHDALGRQWCRAVNGTQALRKEHGTFSRRNCKKIPLPDGERDVNIELVDDGIVQPEQAEHRLENALEEQEDSYREVREIKPVAAKGCREEDCRYNHEGK